MAHAGDRQKVRSVGADGTNSNGLLRTDQIPDLGMGRRTHAGEARGLEVGGQARKVLPAFA